MLSCVIDKDKVPDGYEVDTDVFGFPCLKRKMTSEDKQADRLAFFVCLPLVIGIILYLALH